MIEDVTVEHLDLTLRQQGSHKPGLFDEQPSSRDVYPHDIPAIYVRSAKGVAIQGKIRREGIYKDYPLCQMEQAEDVELAVKER